MPALNLDLLVEQGTTWSHGFIPMIDGTPIIFGGWTAKAQARTAVTDSVVLFEWSTENGTIYIDGEGGSVTMILAPADSSAWTWRTAYYDLEVTSPDGLETYRVVQG